MSIWVVHVVQVLCIVQEMSVVHGVIGIGGVCEMCMCLTCGGVGGLGDELIGFGLYQSCRSGGVWDMSVFGLWWCEWCWGRCV